MPPKDPHGQGTQSNVHGASPSCSEESEPISTSHQSDAQSVLSHAKTASIFAGCNCTQCRPPRVGTGLLAAYRPQPRTAAPAAHDAPGAEKVPGLPTCFVIEYRHTTGAFQPRLLELPQLKHCIEPRHIQGGPVIFIQNPEHHRIVMRAARSLFPRHVVVEESLLELVTSIAEGIKAGRGRKVNEKSRRVLEL
jgi:hypothetical protein